MADLSKLRFNGTDYNVKDASAPTRKFNNAYSKTGNLPITSDDTTQTAIGKLENNIIPKSAKGTANGVAELDANGKVPSSQLPSYVDDVLEYSAKSSFPATGESGKIYVDTTTNKTYRWSGSAYVEISESLALGETDSTAYRGDRGKTAYDHSQLTSGNPHNVTKSDVGLGNVGNFKAVSTVASQGLSNTEKSNARANIGAGTGNGTYSKPSGGIPKSDLAIAVQTSLNQVATNQTNILYALNTGVKNQFPINGMTPGSTMTDHGVTLTYNENGTFTLNGTATGGAATFIMADIPASQNDGKMFKNCILIGGYSSSVYIAVDEWDATVKNRSYNNTTPVDISMPANVHVAVYIRVNGNAQAQNVVVYPFICDKTVYTSDSTFAKPALPNYDLTYLEAEDRAGLIDVVDSGAKNLINLDACTIAATDNRITFTRNGNVITASCTGIPDVQEISITNLSLPTNTALIISGCPSGGSGDTYMIDYFNNGGYVQGQTPDTGSGSGIVTFTTMTNSRIRIRISPNTVFTNKEFKIMVCTKAAFGVSQKFVPFGTDPFYQVPINHNMIYRGRNLGATLTDAQHTALSSGNFTDLYLGDYWTKTVTIPAGTYTGGDGEEVTVPVQTNITLKAVIADFDTFYAGYASGYADINTHHAAVIVTGFSNVVWNKTNSTAGGYVASLIHKWLVGSALPQIETWFGSAKVLSHQKLLTNAITGDAASGWAWSSQKISLLSENQMYGSKVWGNSKATNGGYEPGEAFKHLNVFNHIDANLLFGNKNIWLRDIVSAVWAASLRSIGYAGYDDASVARVAPAALILLS